MSPTILALLLLAPAPQASAPTIAAQGGDQAVTLDEVDGLLVWRHALTENGRSILRQLLDVRVLSRLVELEGLSITPRDVARRYDELDREARAGGLAGGIADYLAETGVDVDVFRETLRLAIAHEVLTRRALGIPEGDPVTSEQQTMWLEDAIRARGYTEEPHPWTGGIVARCGDVELGRAEFLAFLRERLPEESLTDACYELLLAKSIRARMPDLADEAFHRAVDGEIERRRAAAELNPEYKGVPYADLLKANGLSLDALRNDPAIHVAALAHAWVDRRFAGDELRAVYESERDYFDGRFGEGIEVAVLVLKAAKYKNELVPRTFEEADEKLLELRSRIEGVEDFTRLVKLHSEDLRSRESGGFVGVVTRIGTGVPEALVAAVFNVLDAEEGDLSGRLLGPVRLQGASALACLGARRLAPTWEMMSDHVHREMRRRFVDEALPKTSVTTWLDAD